jgi:hypothetical protein
MTNAFDVITMGRIGVDVYPLQAGVSLREVESFGKYLGGSATNVAVAAARYGRRSAVITRTGEDPFGAFLHDALRRFGVDDRWVSAVPGLPTPVTFCEIFPPDDFPLYFYRFPRAPDLEIAPGELDLDAIRAARVFWVTVTGLSQEPSRTATLAALEARANSGITILELDDRFTAYDAAAIARSGFGGGKMLLRIDADDPGSLATIEACSRAVSNLAGRELVAMVEPFMCRRDADPPAGLRVELTPEAVVRSSAIAAGLGTTSAYTWLKLPVVEDMERVAAATTLPVLLLGGEVSEDQDAAFERWAQALTLPTVIGLVVGRSLLYPPDDDVAAAVDAAVGLLPRAVAR